jgi:membrane protease YdiL (CAAX protease family)
MTALELSAPTQDRTSIGALPVAAVGVALLLARPWLVSSGVGVTGLAFLYLALGAISLATPMVATQTRVLQVSRGARRGQASPIGHTGIVLAVGLGAFVVARLMAAPVAPLAVGAPAVGLNLGAALAEEAFFRRFLFGSLLPFGVAGAIVLSSLVFALVHVPLYGGAVFWVDLGAGLLLGWQRWASGSWAAPAATHAVANILAVLR